MGKKIEWEPSLSVNDAVIDEQHQKLISQINELEELLSSIDIDMGSLRSAIDFLYSYIIDHLEYEEKYMEDNKYPDIENHKKIHQKFILFYKEIQMSLKEQMRSEHFSSTEIEKMLQKIEKYLVMWIEHIKTIDQKYAQYIKKH